MTHFGIICPPVTGHLNPMTTLGYELQRRGHKVTSVSAALMINEDISVPPFNTAWKCDRTWRGKLRNRIGYRLLRQLRQPIRKTIAQYRREWNLSSHYSQNDAYSKLAQLCQQPAEFEFPRENLPSCFHSTGAYHNLMSRAKVDFPFEKLTGQPLIYASMGTLQNRLIGIFKTIAEACAGLNTALESIIHGVPMVAIPITNDQPGVAARIVWTGCGEMIKLSKLNVPQRQTAIERVFTQASYRDNAIRLQTANQQAGE
ncbi:glycosyltransferase [Synechocystis sp. PCC 7509]|uniref:glycosyltransferase n=1 Tax=Synechocystis sp. PCC 7509 TaxID=927677 RepID=UPI0002AC02DD|nr:UDP-glucoronosyl and UDP-glucosyl transferase [Synechocystis sp. PCC 7509]